MDIREAFQLSGWEALDILYCVLNDESAPTALRIKCAETILKRRSQRAGALRFAQKSSCKGGVLSWGRSIRTREKGRRNAQNAYRGKDGGGEGRRSRLGRCAGAVPENQGRRERGVFRSAASGRDDPRDDEGEELVNQLLSLAFSEALRARASPIKLPSGTRRIGWMLQALRSTSF